MSVTTKHTKDTKRELPPGWRWSKLGNFMPKIAGTVTPALCPNEVFTLYSIPSFDQGAPECVLGKTIGSSKQLVQKGDVLLSKIVPHIRRTWVVASSSETRTIASTEWIVFRTEQANPDFLKFALLDDDFHKAFMDTTSGVGGSLTRARPALVRNLEIALPPLPEQKRIAAILKEQMAAIDKARAAAEARLEAVLALPAAVVHESLRRGKRTRRLLGDCLVEVKKGVGVEWAKYPVLGATRGGLAPAKEGVGKAPERYKLVDPVTVFYNPMRILLGSIAMVDEGDRPGITSPDYVVLKGREGILDTRWFYYWFRSTTGASLINSLSRGAVRERMLFNRLAAGEIEIPDYAAQLYASERMAQVRPIIDGVTQELAAINALPAVLLRRAFNGEL